MSTFPWPDKDPADSLDYSIDWTALLAGDTIASVVWTIPAGLTGGTASNTTTVTTRWISGGTAGTSYVVTARVTSVGGRVFERSASLYVADL